MGTDRFAGTLAAVYGLMLLDQLFFLAASHHLDDAFPFHRTGFIGLKLKVYQFHGTTHPRVTCAASGIMHS